MSIVNSNNFLYKTVDGVKQFFSPLVSAATVVRKDGTRLEQDGIVSADTLHGKVWSEMILEIYPVGSIYISASATSPASLFGGTWEQIEGRFLLACGDNGDGWNYSPGSTGGEPTHKLTVNEMPSHTHVIYRNTGTDDSNFSGHIANRVAANDTDDAQKQTVTSDATGGSAAHNNMPPYLAVYMWKRVN